MAAKHNFRRNIAQVLDIPPEVISGTPRLILTGNEQLLAENHHGIIEYLPTKIAFKTAQGKVEVVGEHLLLASLSSDELIVEGNIMAVRLVAEGTNV